MLTLRNMSANQIVVAYWYLFEDTLSIDQNTYFISSFLDLQTCLLGFLLAQQREVIAERKSSGSVPRVRSLSHELVQSTLHFTPSNKLIKSQSTNQPLDFDLDI